jgi:hypothetical protein
VGGDIRVQRAEDDVWCKHIAKGDTIFVFASENLMTDLENLELELIDPRN